VNKNFNLKVRVRSAS